MHALRVKMADTALNQNLDCSAHALDRSPARIANQVFNDSVSPTIVLFDNCRFRIL